MSLGIARYSRFILTIVLGVFLASCSVYDEMMEDDKEDYLDRDLKMNYSDYEEKFFPEREIKPQRQSPKIPELADILTAPKPPSLGTDKLITLSVTEEVPVKEVLIEIARLADVDMEVDPGISGGIILRVKDKPFSQVVARVSALAGLRHSEEDGILRIERDLPYLKNYSVDYLNLVRSSSGSVNVNTQVLGGSGDSGGEGLSGGSSNAITSSYDGDLWASVENTIQSILAFAPTSLAVNTSDTGGGTSYSINRQAGVISVLANERQHKNVQNYIEQVRKSVSAQVLIEAKIVEVALDEDYRTGIDWGTLQDLSAGLEVTGKFNPVETSGGNFFTIGGAESISTAVSLTETFGVTRTLSSPRLHAMNNQQAVLTFAENNVYFTLEVEEETEGTGTDAQTTLTIESTLNTVPIGVIVTLLPSINTETNEITMNIRPTLSRITSTVTDPGVDIIVARSETVGDVSSSIPVIEVRELDSILKIKSGEVMVIGGLMSERSQNTDSGVPYLSRIPLFGHAFKGVTKDIEVVETIIFIRATIVNDTTKVEKKDRQFYQDFMKRDRRPIAF